MITDKRNAGLDVARGLAVLGTFATNVWVFTHPDGLPGTLFAPVTDGLGSALAQALPLGKSLALLSLLFGIGLELQRRSALRRGLPWNRTHRVRALVLFAEAGVHFLLVAEFDVLMGYAVAALLAGPVLVRPDRTRRRLVAVLLTTHVLALGALVVVLSRAATVPGGPLVTPYATGSFWELVVFRVENLAVFRTEPVGLLLLSTASFLLGAGLVRRGILEAARGRVLRRRLVVAGAAGVVLEAVFLVAGGPFGILLTRYASAVLIALGVLAVVLEVQGRRPQGPGWAGRRSAEVGRAALSCYVLQNLLASALCYGWGLGLATRFGPEHRSVVTASVFTVVAAAVVVFAHVLARTGRRGPLEAFSARAQRAVTPRSPERRSRAATPGAAARTSTRR
ncbi:DUF418 domain-containing protein [Kineococcus sp. SYSU DK003]|uniref:DUF418 domain-containing protein n=1 Tax=Kineococcus sp. SYSU DK003 TaxID=3383124 RepID=UPI003D7E5F36